MNKIFIYNEFLNTRIQSLLRIKPVKEELAIITGKLYHYGKTHILLKKYDISRPHGKSIVFGALMTFKDEDMLVVLDVLDAYHVSSQHRTSIIRKEDYTYRTTSTVFVQDNPDLSKLKYGMIDVSHTTSCFTYFGITTKREVIRALKNTHNKMINGHCGKPFTNFIKRMGLL